MPLVFEHYEDRTPTHGYEATREAAKEVFYDAPHSCIAGAADIHSSIVRPKQ
jgi:hypothetical protein